MGKRILYVTGFSRDTRARDLAHAFERYGRLVRCDIPGARRDSKPFAFVEYEDSRDADDAYDRMHDQYIGDHRISVQWAKRPPARSWRFDGDSRHRSRSPRRHSPRRRSPERGARRRRSSSRDHRDRRDYRRDSRSPDVRSGSVGRRHRSGERRDKSPDARSISAERRDRSLSPRYRREGSEEADRIHAEPDGSSNAMNVDLDAPTPEKADDAHHDDSFSNDEQE
ncbi:hypothetical protein BX070DRAFT_222853 [Coemansia spiralis]|nr:hypothetical protein BX070DRAFT_222853 [Coemansia spiralis]